SRADPASASFRYWGSSTKPWRSFPFSETLYLWNFGTRTTFWGSASNPIENARRSKASSRLIVDLAAFSPSRFSMYAVIWFVPRFAALQVDIPGALGPFNGLALNPVILD